MGGSEGYGAGGHRGLEMLEDSGEVGEYRAYPEAN